MATAAVVGAVAVGLAALAIGAVARPGSEVVAATAVVCALCVLLGFSIPGSIWRIPQAWGRFGPTMFSGVFGAALGSGVAVALPATGFIILLFAAAAAPVSCVN